MDTKDITLGSIATGFALLVGLGRQWGKERDGIKDKALADAKIITDTEANAQELKRVRARHRSLRERVAKLEEWKKQTDWEAKQAR